MIDWDNLRFFLTAVRAGNYTAAAKRLRVDRTTVGRRLERLEHQAGVPLFEQGEEGYHPTAAGRRVLGVADQIEALIAGLGTDLSGESEAEQAELRIAIATELGSEFLPELAAFSRSHPNIRLRMNTSGEPEDDVITRKCEVGLCLVDPIPRHLRGTRIGTLRQAGYASHAYLEARGHGLPPQEYEWVRCASSSRVRAMKQWDDIFCRTIRVSAYVDSWPALKQSVEQGLGAGFLWTFVADSIANLDRVTPLHEELGTGLHLLVRDDVPMDQPTRTFLSDMAPRLSQRLTYA
ncbi:LysR family transcriptional regulator [Sphingobium sp. EM0848]|uniref:LysR family transcriptional regulator n=1 Tax=Sphingobium sp. EM0848 TaxID=2743473 RepID=UPI0021010A4D|nr:LysR family transcriptional regulator [Sphingobium sp. EM0848]